MKYLVAIICVWAVASAELNFAPQSPPSEPEVLPEPKPELVVGLLTQVFQKLSARLELTDRSIDELQHTNEQELLNFIRESGGPASNILAKIQFFQKQANDFWQFIVDVLGDLTWDLNQYYGEALSTIEKEFRLVINQPLVRSWLRKLRDLPRIGRNLALQAIQRRHDQFDRLVLQVTADLGNLVRSELCQNPDAFQERFYRIFRLSYAEYLDIISNMKNDIRLITLDFVDSILKLANKIYEVDVLASKYFVS